MADGRNSGLSRRGFLQAGASLAGGLLLPAWAGLRPASAQLAPLNGGRRLLLPDFAGRISIVAGVRPYREDGVRLDWERIEQKYIVHNYGHGGAGITLSFGTARKAGDLVADVFADIARYYQPRAAAKLSGKIAIVGAGVAGLTAATELHRRFPKVEITLYSKDKLEDVTSYKAGGQFAPAGITKPYEHRIGVLHKYVSDSHERLMQLMNAGKGRAYGIARRSNYSIGRNNPMDRGVPRPIIPEPLYGTLPFEGLKSTGGYEYHTLLIEPPIFLKKLRSELRKSRNIKFRTQDFHSRADVLALPQSIVVNCSGMGAKTLFDDQTLKPIKGQLIKLKNPKHLNYFYSEHCNVTGADTSYLFCRRNDIVVGGTYENSVGDTTPVPADCDRIIERMQRLLGGTTSVCIG